ncbi:phosphate ABC transporter substrate-binding protein PstS family protein [Phocicoccus pinnipedialis]|uniref:Phosphate-binding protein n=1 Tax=Phocicoccus pinnipedialis TaxID=110845 RepID=A0A6V7RFP4_9BACL|nr:phosphate ABC transporter substrate-binding protein PstS family protein [Jeotgalicoccus pinnipedialis]MBP1939291.1 phosphate transport system substrate-binding protein [Jeotgalicoccus pinnipedialis]CAD2076007.1 Phosphate-binding protein PstS precursor [Jeotgalicoccus pinnipedialis]
MKQKLLSLLAIFLMGFVLTGCGSTSADSEKADGSDNAKLSKNEKIIGDGSSTVFPILEIVNEEFNAEYGKAAEIGVSGTGAGFDKFIAGETDFQNASRGIKDEEKKALEDAGIEYTELQVGTDGLTVAVNMSNDFVTDLTFEELYKIYKGEAKTWKDVRSDFPNEEIKVYGPDQSHGTHDFFVEEVMNDEDVVGELIQDTNQVVNAVASDEYAIGFFGYNYYLNNQDTLKAISIKGPDNEEAVEPTEENVKSFEYPLSRPLYIYVSNKSVKENNSVKTFLNYTLEISQDAAVEAGYVGLDDVKLKEEQDKLESIK